MPDMEKEKILEVPIGLLRSKNAKIWKCLSTYDVDTQNKLYHLLLFTALEG